MVARRTTPRGIVSSRIDLRHHASVLEITPGQSPSHWGSLLSELAFPKNPQPVLCQASGSASALRAYFRINLGGTQDRRLGGRLGRPCPLRRTRRPVRTGRAGAASGPQGRRPQRPGRGATGRLLRPRRPWPRAGCPRNGGTRPRPVGRRAGGPAGRGQGRLRRAAGGGDARITGPPRARPAWPPWASPTGRHPRAGGGRRAGPAA